MIIDFHQHPGDSVSSHMADHGIDMSVLLPVGQDGRQKIKKMIQEDPWQIRYALKLVPLEKVVSTSTDEIVEAVKDLSRKISKGEKFRISVNKRHTKLDRLTLIKAVAAFIDRKVDLENPDKIVNIEIVGNWTGISILKSDDIFSIGKRRQF